MTFELGSIIAGIATMIVGIITMIVTSVNNKRSFNISNKNLELAQEEFKASVLNKSKMDLYNTIGQEIIGFLQSTSFYKLYSYYRRTMMEKEIDDLSKFFIEVSSLIDEIEICTNRVCIIDVYLEKELLMKLRECKEESTRILNALMDFKVSSSAIYDKCKEEGLERNNELKKAGLLTYMNEIKASLNDYARFAENLERELFDHNEILKRKLINSSQEKE